MKRLHLAGASPPQNRRSAFTSLGNCATNRSRGGGLVASKHSVASHGGHGCGAAPRTTLPPGIASASRTSSPATPGNNGATTVRSGRNDYGLGAHHC